MSSSHPRLHRTPPRGRATGWLVLAIAVAAILIALSFLAPSRQHAPQPHPQAKTRPTYDHARAKRQITGLQQQLMTVMAQHRNPTPLIASVRAFVKEFPPDADGWTLLGQILTYDNQSKPAYDAMVKSLKLKPDQPRVEAMAGTLAMKINRPDLAAVHYAQAVSLDAGTPRYRVLLATAQIQLHQYDKARLTLLGALSMDSSLYQAHAELASLYAAQDKLTEALDQIKRAIDMTPDRKADEKAIYIRRRAKLLRRANRPADALSVLQGLPFKQRNTIPVLHELALSWAMLNQPAKAAANYEKARLYLPNDKRIIAAAIHWHLKAHQINQARKDLADLRNIDPQWPQIQTLQQQINHAAPQAAR